MRLLSPLGFFYCAVDSPPLERRDPGASMQPKSTNSLFFRVPEGTTPDEALEWLTERTIELVSRPETLLGIGEYELRALEAGWLELVCAPSPSPISTGMLGPWLGIAESIAKNWGSQVIGLSFREGSLSLVAANGPARARRLEYDPGRGWTTSEGAARAWERAAFFSEDARVAALNRAGGWLRAWKARQAIVAAYELDEVQVGSLQPAPPADVVERVLSSLEIKRSVLKRIPLWLPPGPHVEIVEPLDSSFPENLRRAWIGLRLPVASVAAREPSTVNVNREQALARLFAVNQSASVAFQLERFRLPGTNEEISFRAEQCRLLAPPSAAP